MLRERGDTEIDGEQNEPEGAVWCKATATANATLGFGYILIRFVGRMIRYEEVPLYQHSPPARFAHERELVFPR